VGEWGDRLGDLLWGGLVGSDGWTYRFSAEDAMWGTRMIVGEAGGACDGPEGDAILWTMANRLYLLRKERFQDRRGVTLWPPHRYTHLIRAYAQPINPYFLDPRHESDPDRLRRRWQVTTLPPRGEWRGVPIESAIRRVVRFMQGGTPNQYVGLVHFGQGGVEEFVAEHGTPETMPFLARNWFWKSGATRGWTSRTLNPAAPVDPGIGLALPLVVGAGLVGAYLALRHVTGSSWLGLGAVLPFVPP